MSSEPKFLHQIQDLVLEGDAGTSFLSFRETYIEYWIASTAVFEGKKSLTATSLFSFFLSVQVC
jgi:hypothetical protein